MVDIETYRARIGSFGVSGMSTSKLKLKIKLRCKVQRQVSMECSVQTLIFLCMVTSTMLCVSLHYQEQGNTYTGTTPSHTDSLYVDTQCLFEYVHELYKYILMIYVVKLTEISLLYTSSHRSSRRALNIGTPGTNTQATLMENIFNGSVHGTCSYLIGNVGTHAYNGNPPKKSGPEIYNLHSAMVLKLSKTIAPSKRDEEMENRWHFFTSMLCRPDLLSHADITGLRSMFDVFRILMEKGKIDYGNYEVVKGILSELELKQCLDIITQHEKQMTSTPQDVQGTAETTCSHDTASTLYSRDTAETVVSRDTAETVYSRDTAKTVYSGDTAASSHNKMHSGSEQRVTSSKTPLAGHLPIKVDVLSECPPSPDKNHIYDAMIGFLLSVLGKIPQESETTEEMLTKFDEWLLRYKSVKAERKCLMIYVACGSRKALKDLWQMYQSGELLEILQNGLITRDLLTKCGMESIQIGVFISEEDYKRCLKNIADPVTTDHAITTTRQKAIDAEGFKPESGRADTDTEMKAVVTETVEKLDIGATECVKSKIMEIEENPDIIETEISDTRDTEDIQPGIVGIESKQDTRDTEDIQPDIMGIETQDTGDTEDIQPGIMGIETQDTRDTEDIQPGIMGIESKQDTRDTEGIQPDVMGIETQDTRDTEDIQPGIMGIESKQDTRDIEGIQPDIMGIETQDTRDTEGIQPDIMGIESKQDTRETEGLQPGIIGTEISGTSDTEDIQPDIVGIKIKQDTRDTEDITAGECSMDTLLFKEDNTMDTAVDVTETGQDFKEWVPPTAGIDQQQDVKREECKPSQADPIDVLAQHAAAFGAAETVYSRDTAASSHNKMPSVDMEASVKVWRSNDKLCYETKGIKDVVQTICSEEHSYICVVGEPGCGKSTAIRHAALYLKDKFGFIIYPVSGPKQFIDYLDPDTPQVFIYDDFCGEYFIDQDKLKAWGEYNEKIKDCLQFHKNTKVLFSMRVQLHSELKSKGNTHIYNDQRHVINFSDKEYKLSRDTMKDMLRHYLQIQHVQNIEGLIRRVWWGAAEQFAGCFPLLCKVFSDDESVRVNPWKYFSDPLPALQNIFKRIKSDNKHQFCGLLLCGVTDLKDEYFSPLSELNKPKHFNLLIKSQKLDPDTDLDNIKQALNNLDGVYISHIGNRYTFLHSIFQNIVTFLYDDKYYVFKYATLYFIHTCVRLFSKFDTDDDYVKVFYGDDCVELLVDRMIEELRSDDTDRWVEGVSFIVNSHYIDNKELITCLMEKLFDSEHTQITQNKIDWLFGECLITVCGYTSSRPHTDVTSCRLYQLLLSLIARCDCKKQIGGWPGYPLLTSVFYGSLPVTKALVEHQADVNVVGRYGKRCVLHWAVDCRNNVDMTKYLLSLPNLKCLNHRDSDGFTPYWYVVNNKSPTGYWSVVPHRDELMKLYKHTAAICE